MKYTQARAVDLDQNKIIRRAVGLHTFAVFSEFVLLANALEGNFAIKKGDHGLLRGVFLQDIYVSL